MTGLAPVLISDSSLTGWQLIGSGGFGQIYRARHRQWCYDVAVKLLRFDDGSSSSLLRESELMRRGSSEYVMQVLGVFKGRPPNSGPSEQLGLVMKFMEKGSLTSLQASLNEAPPWPLVLRLAHQVSLGINFLHSLSPTLLHLDLKPSNVLLDSYLNVKLTDFGLAKIYHSVSRVSRKSSEEEEGGTISYMPPEAFEVDYIPRPASDIYSYGVLLWSIVTGKQPYANAVSSIVRLRIPRGDRPSLEEFRGQAEGRVELRPLMELMTRCWESRPDRRPSACDCSTVTEELYQTHKHNVLDAVHQVLRKLEQKEPERLPELQRLQLTQTSELVRVEALNICDNAPTGRPPVQEVAGDWTNHRQEAVRVTDKQEVGVGATQEPGTGEENLVNVQQTLWFVQDPPTPRPSDLRHVDPPCSVKDSQEVKVSSVHPIGASPLPPSTRGSSQGREAENQQRTSRPNLRPQYQRQRSSPVTSSTRPPSAHNVCIHLSNVTGLQSGNFNTMNIYDSERRRHPTAPPSVNLPPRCGSRKNK